MPGENELPRFITTGTSIAIIAKADQIAAAADSKIILGRNRLLSSDCKIKQSGDAFFTIAGHRREELSSFDAIFIAKEVFRTSYTAADRVDEPGIVGPPIDLLQITKTGAVWKQRKPEC